MQLLNSRPIVKSLTAALLIVATILDSNLISAQKQVVQAKDPTPFQWVVLVDARAGSRPKIASLPWRDLTACIEGDTAIKGNAPSPLGYDEVAILKVLSQNCVAKKNRWISNAGDSILVIAAVTGNGTFDITFKETVRTSRVYQDVGTLLDLATRIGGGRASSENVAILKDSYVLTEGRSSFKVGVTSSSGTATNTLAEISLVTGPKERVFLSANTGVTSAKQVSYDKQSASLTPAGTPKEFYIGINGSFSDLYADRSSGRWSRFRQSGWIGIEIEGSTQPLRQIGALFGLRYIPWVSDWAGLEKVSPYVGLIWVRDDLAPSGSVAGMQLRTRYSTGRATFGLSLNLTESLSWLGGEKKK